MGREFVMGARMVLKDMFTRTMQDAAKKTKAARDEMGRFTAQTKSASDGLFSLKGAMAAVAAGAVMKKGFDWLVGANADMETYKNTLTVVMGSQEKAVQTLAWAQKFAAKTPFEIPQIVEATTRMSAYGLNAEKTLGIVGDMASVMGKDLMQAVEAVADAQTGELERLKEFGITKKMIEQQAQLMGAAVTNSKGQITDQKAFNAALFSLMEKRYKGGMEMQASTFKGMVSNVQDFVGTVGRKLGEPIFAGVSNGLSNVLDWLNRMQENGTIDLWIGRVQDFGAVVYDVFTSTFGWAYEQVMTVKDGIAEFYSDNKPKIDALGDSFANVFNTLAEYATPIITFLKDDAIPLLVWGLQEVGGWVLDIANWFNENWSGIGPIIYGLVGAWAAYNAIQKAVYLWSQRQVVITGIMTAKQWLLNTAMNANPLMITITLIGLLIGSFIALMNNWDTVKEKAAALWEGITNGFKKGVNWVIGVLNKMIDGINSAFSFTLPDWLGGGHFELGIPHIPTLSVDGSHKDGLPNVPFDGYLAELHKGERVLTAQENRAYSNAAASPSELRGSVSDTTLNVAERAVVVYAAPGQSPDEIAEAVLDRMLNAVTGAGQIMGNTSRGVLLANG